MDKNKKPTCIKCGSILQVVCPNCKFEQGIDCYIKELSGKTESTLSDKLQKSEDEAKRWQNSYNELRLDRDRLSKSVTAIQSNTVSSYSKGKIQQLSLNDMLQQAFPKDFVRIIHDGVNGADVELCLGGEELPWAKILIESKNAKEWESRWIVKLRNDKINAKADLAILVTKIRTNHSNDSGIAIMSLDEVIPYLELIYPLLQSVSAQKSLLNNDKLIEAYNYITTTLLDRIKQTITIARKFNDRGEALIKQGDQLKRDSFDLIRNLTNTRDEIIPLLPARQPKLLK